MAPKKRMDLLESCDGDRCDKTFFGPGRREELDFLVFDRGKRVSLRPDRGVYGRGLTKLKGPAEAYSWRALASLRPGSGEGPPLGRLACLDLP
jgi:hypothetical protein